MTDLDRVREALIDVERSARSHAWANERPWRVATHVWAESGLPVVDLHDLGSGTGSKAVRAALGAAPHLDAGAVAFVTGRGRHSAGRGVLGRVVETELRQACTDNPEWRFRPHGAGRWVLVVDPDKAPGAARTRLSPLVWVVAAGLFLAAIAAVCSAR